MSGATGPGTVDALYTLPLGEFTSARNALVAQLKKAGRQGEANEAKALAKPSVSAWVVNQLYRRHRGLFDQLIEAGDRVRRAQGAQLTADSAREAVNARREALAALTAIAADLLRDGNYSATRDMLRRVTSTLEALSSYGSRPDAPAAGRLADDVEPPGFDALAGLLTGSGKRVAGETRARVPAPRTAPELNLARRANRDATARRDEAERKGAVAAAKAAVREAAGALRAARKQAERAAEKRDAAAASSKAIERQRAQLEARLAQASKDAKKAREVAAEAAANASEATAAANGAERALELARKRLQQIAGNKA
jgi:hypothetical protein